MKRIFHRYEKCEEYSAGMWRKVPPQDRQQYVKASAELMLNPQMFRAAMIKAANEWKHSCETNLTAPTVNKRAWLGHAGCCIQAGSPEDLTREAWGALDQEAQDLANQMADEAIAYWMERHAKA